MKREYNVLKEARKQSGAHWDGKTGRITATPAVWKNILDSHPRAKNFRSKSFPLFDALGELYDGQTAEGTYNYTSIQQHQHPDHTQVESGDELANKEVEILDVEDTVPSHEEDEEAEQEEDNVHDQRRDDGYDKILQRREDGHDQMPQRRAAATQSREEKEPKRQKKSSNLEVLMGTYIEIKKKQVEEEASYLSREREQKKREMELKEAELSREMEESQVNDFSIKKCISVLGTLEVTKQEKAKAYSVFKDYDNRQVFLSAMNDDPESALIWLKNEIA